MATKKEQIIKVLATGFGTGLSPVAPGTAGTLAGVLICLFCAPMTWPLRVLFVFAVSAASVYIAGQAETIYGKKDDQRIVIDEIAGFQTAMLPVDITGLHLCLAFLLFRIFDIWKPFPVNRLQNLPGGYGVVADDLGAGIYSGFILFYLTTKGL
ncbi:MAG: phosphatidylglycerophosphatase A [Syntrophaceae bacterium]|jgi:phosphatidylglycerophosphatase A|nr:phosphatidylglycerophosphatase A [Syntrophaceae bacterium]HOC60417.1 phosphatidylglycerophosphatase A [Smithellaceae bacterium]HQM45945.1 phosphatidylglycerophosphatase A [Smithellaceae bacterium]